MTTGKVQELWNLWLAGSKELMQTLYEQTAAVMLRDTARLDRVGPVIAQQIAELKRIDQMAVRAMRELSLAVQTRPDIIRIAEKLEKAEAQQFIALSNRVKSAAQAVYERASKNKSMIETELPAVWAKTEAGHAAVQMAA